MKCISKSFSADIFQVPLFNFFFNCRNLMELTISFKWGKEAIAWQKVFSLDFPIAVKQGTVPLAKRLYSSLNVFFS